MKRPVPGLGIEQQPADVLLTMLAYGEARNQSGKGLLAVVWVALNRAYGPAATIPEAVVENPTRLSGVILKPLQFSCFNATDPNRGRLLEAYRNDPHAWARCWGVVELALSGLTADPTRGATHYYTTDKPSWAEVWPPKWGQLEHGWHPTVVIGDHSFGRAA